MIILKFCEEVVVVVDAAAVVLLLLSSTTLEEKNGSFPCLLKSFKIKTFAIGISLACKHKGIERFRINIVNVFLRLRFVVVVKKIPFSIQSNYIISI